MQISRAEIKFKHRKTKHSFVVIHNLNLYQINIEDALVNWSERTGDLTVNSFCRYVKSKDPNFICMSENEYNDLLKS